MPDSQALSDQGMRLVYKGDGDYDVIAGPVTIELAYDGSDYSVGRWDFWNLNIYGQRVGGTGIVGPGPFHDWLEENARGEGGRLPDEPESALQIDETSVAGSGADVEITARSWDPAAAGRRAVEKHGEALKRLSDQEGASDA